MKIININTQTNYNSATQFKGLRVKPKTLADIRLLKPNKFRPEANAISEIKNVHPYLLGGTKCNNSIPLKNFWDFFEADGRCVEGFSTNKDGFANSFLKAKSNVPLSTSFVHDCSVMYLFKETYKGMLLYQIVASVVAYFVGQAINNVYLSFVNSCLWYFLKFSIYYPFSLFI